MIIKLLRSSVLLVLCSCVGITAAQAQNFVPAQALEYTYNGPAINGSEDVSCYSFRNETPTAWGNVDVYLAGWGNNEGEVTVLFTAPGDPADVKYQGIIPCWTGLNIAVGATFNQNTNTMQVLVAYENQGFKLDIYDITTSSSTPLVLNTTMDLTNDPLTNFARHRIRMDTHRDRAVVIWDYPNHGIQAIGCENGSWGSVVDIQNTYGFEGPDVSLNEIQGVPQLQMVYFSQPPVAFWGYIKVETLDFNTLMTAPGFATPSGGGNFYTGAGTSLWGYPNLCIDSKDYADYENWAFVGTYPNVPALYVSYHYDNGYNTPTNGIMAVNTGLLGNASLGSGFTTVSPALHFGGGPYGPEQVMMGWYASSNSYHGYMGLSMKTDYSGLVSDLDYLEFTNATSPYQTISGLAFSKEDKQLAPDYLYAVYYNRQTATGPYDLHHAFHKWDNTAFKKELELKVSMVRAYPNPFLNELHTTVTASENGFVSLQLMDVTGRMVFQKKYTAQKGNNAFALDGLQHLISGTYFLNTVVNGKAVNTQTVVKQ